MMLQALIAYAERRELQEPGFLKQDFQGKELDWLIQILPDGTLVKSLVSLERQTRVCPFRPEDELNQGDEAHFLADQLCRAVLLPEPSQPAKAKGRALQHFAFKQMLRDAAEACSGEVDSLKAVLAVLDDSEQLKALHSLLSEAKARPNHVATFSVTGRWLLDSAELSEFWIRRRAATRAAAETCRRVCIATGKLSDVLFTTDKIRGLPGGNAKLIAFDKPAFVSFNLKKGENAAISIAAELKIRSALNELVKRGLPLGEVAHIHWTREAGGSDPFDLVNTPNDEAVENLLNSPRTGFAPAGMKRNAYYAASLCGVKGRIMVRDWIESTLPEVETSVRDWFDEMTVMPMSAGGVRAHFGLYSLLATILPRKRSKPDFEKLPPQLHSQLLRAALTGAQLPRSVLASAISRQNLGGEFKLYPARLALIKLYLVRNCSTDPGKRKRMNDQLKQLDPNSADIADLCGQLFAVIGRLQRHALGKIGTSLAERTYGGVATRPASTLGPVFNKVPAYVKKANSRLPGSGTNRQKEIALLCARIKEINAGNGKEGFPALLSLEEQGRFALGYYAYFARIHSLPEEARLDETAEKLPTDE